MLASFMAAILLHRRRLEPETELREQREIFAPFDVGMCQRLRELDDTRNAACLNRKAEAGRRGGLAARRVLLEGGADVVEAVERRAAQDARRVEEIAAKLDLCA